MSGIGNNTAGNHNRRNNIRGFLGNIGNVLRRPQRNSISDERRNENLLRNLGLLDVPNLRANRRQVILNRINDQGLIAQNTNINLIVNILLSDEPYYPEVIRQAALNRLVLDNDNLMARSNDLALMQSIDRDRDLPESLREVARNRINTLEAPIIERISQINNITELRRMYFSAVSQNIQNAINDRRSELISIETYKNIPLAPKEIADQVKDKVCPITYEPRDELVNSVEGLPVALRVSNDVFDLYDLTALKKWCKQHRTHPTTRERLTEDMLSKPNMMYRLKDFQQ